MRFRFINYFAFLIILTHTIFIFYRNLFYLLSLPLSRTGHFFQDRASKCRPLRKVGSRHICIVKKSVLTIVSITYKVYFSPAAPRRSKDVPPMPTEELDIRPPARKASLPKPPPPASSSPKPTSIVTPAPIETSKSPAKKESSAVDTKKRPASGALEASVSPKLPKQKKATVVADSESPKPPEERLQELKELAEQLPEENIDDGVFLVDTIVDQRKRKVCPVIGC